MNRIRMLREKKGIKQAELAQMVGLSTVTLSRYENSRRSPQYDEIKKIASALETSVAYLMGETDEDESLSADTPLSTAAAEDKTDKTNQMDIATILSMLQKLSDNDNNGFADHLSKTINKNTSIPQIIAVIAQLHAYLSELSPDELPKPNRRTISDLLAACQRVINAIEIDEDDTVPITDDSSHQATAKIIEDCYRH